ESLLAVVGLRDEKALDVHPKLRRVNRVECVLGVDESRSEAHALGLGDHMERESRFARGFRPVDFDDAAARQAADADGEIEAERARRDRVDLLDWTVAETQNRALAEVLLYLRE